MQKNNDTLLEQTFNILMTCHLIFVTQGTWCTEHSLEKENINCALFKDKIP